MRKSGLFLIGLLILTGCTTPRQMTLLITDRQGLVEPKKPQYIIDKGDILNIAFSAIREEAIAPYNSAGTNFIVKEDGTITVPVLGKIQVVGNTEEQVVEILTNMVRTQVQNPIVQVTISNAKVAILGEVRLPQVLSVPQPISLIDALGMVGGVTDNADCKKVVIQRKEKGVINTYYVNILTDEIYSSPCYYLLKGDVVIIAPKYAKILK